MTDDNGLLDMGASAPEEAPEAGTEPIATTEDAAAPHVPTAPVNAPADAEADMTDDNEEDNDVEANWDFIPSKFLDEDGEPNLEDMAESYKKLEQGVIEKNVPEAYDDEAFEELGLSWGEGEEAEAWKDKVTDAFKKGNMSQSDFDTLMPLYSEALQSMAVMGTTPIDKEVEKQKMLEAYGSPEAAQQATSDISAFAKTLNDDLFKYPIHQSAAGMVLLHKLAKDRTGPALVSSKQTAVDVVDLQAKAGKIVNDPAYGSNTAAGRALEAEMDVISNKIAQNRNTE